MASPTTKHTIENTKQDRKQATAKIMTRDVWKKEHQKLTTARLPRAVQAWQHKHEKNRSTGAKNYEAQSHTAFKNSPTLHKTDNWWWNCAGNFLRQTELVSIPKVRRRP